jgi:type VI secretion system protein ImpA
MTPTAFFQSLYRSTSEIQEEVERLVRTLEPRCAKATPRLHRIRQMIGSIRQFAVRILEERQDSLPLRMDPAALVDTEAEYAEFDSARFHFRSRAEAYRLLLEAAEYLARVEPHSPTPYLVKRAVSWGGMSVVDLFEELVKDRNDKNQIFELLGVTRTP